MVVSDDLIDPGRESENALARSHTGVFIDMIYLPGF